jgi:hypothetical protein
VVPLDGGNNLQVDGGFYLPEPDEGEQGPTTVTVSLNDNKDSQYRVEFIERSGRTWTYKVTEVQGRDLSHWSLGGETTWNCVDNIVAYSPGGASIGQDGSTGFHGIKWDTAGSFSNGYFSFTLDKDYTYKTVKALAKAGTVKATTDINGPDCDAEVATPTPTPTLTPVPSATATPVPSATPTPTEEPNACIFRWLDWNGGTSSNTELRNDMLDTSRSGVRLLGDEIAAGPPASDSALVADGMNANTGKVLLVPLANWDGNGYIVCGFARIRLID